MNWLEDRIRLAGLFLLGAVVPVAALLFTVAAGVLALCATSAGWGRGLLFLGVLLLAHGGYGLYLGFKSWPKPALAGRQLGKEEAPELTGLLQACCASWKGPRVNTVVLDPHSWNLDLLGTPVLGLLGWPRFHWVVGVYPLLALSAREVDAVLSWEVVWWSDQQAWLNLQIKRLVAYWQLLHAFLCVAPLSWKNLWLAGFLRPYSGWMVRFMQGFLVRECLWTDSVVAEQHGAGTYARALCRLAILGPLVDRHVFPELLLEVRAGNPIPEDLYGHMERALVRCTEPAREILALALDGLVPHAPPLLKLRLNQLGVTPEVPMPPAVPAIHHFLDGTPVLRELEDGLRLRIQAQLDKASRRRQEGDRRYRELGLLVGEAFPRHPQALEYLGLAFDRTPAQVFSGMILAFLEVNWVLPDIQFLMVKWYLRNGLVEEARSQIRSLLLQNPFLAPVCHSLVAEYHRKKGELALAGQEWNLARRAEALVSRAHKERGSASLGDALEPHGCAEPQLEAIVSYLKALGELGEAFLVRKKLALHPDHPVLLLVVRPRISWWDPRGRKRRAFQSRIARECPFPGQSTGYVLVLGTSLLWPHRRLFKSLGALILRRTV